MQTDHSVEHLRCFNEIKEQVPRIFQEEMTMVSEGYNYAHHGWFSLKYFYARKEYDIEISSEFDLMSVRIQRQDGAFTHLNQ